jgi:hypothetical protein
MTVRQAAKSAEQERMLIVYSLLICIWKQPDFTGELSIKNFWTTFNFLLDKLECQSRGWRKRLALTPAKNPFSYFEVINILHDLEKQNIVALKADGQLKIPTRAGNMLWRMVKDLGFDEEISIEVREACLKAVE